MDIVVSGHYLGGAVASIVAIKLFIGSNRQFQKRSVKCITFGTPPFGDRNLQNYVAVQMSSCMHHFICINEPVPKLLRYAQSFSPRIQGINNRLTAIIFVVKSPEGSSFKENTINKLMDIKE